jgi:N-acetylglucosamine repressor
VPKMDSTYINKLNKIKVLELIRKEKSISRADIAKAVRLSAPTITRIVDSLIRNEKLVVDLGVGSSDGGRPPNLVSFASDSRFIIGVDIGRTTINAALADLDAKIVQESKLPTGAEDGFKKVMERVAAIVEELIARSRVDRRDIMGVGLAIGGIIDKKLSIIEFSPDFGWTDVDPASMLSKLLGLPVRIDNVTRLTAVGELHYGIGKKYRDFICVNVGYGIGAGIIVEGAPYYGSHGAAGEFGHIVVSKDDERLCNCGNRGCIEAIASGYGIARTMRENIGRGKSSSLVETCNGDLEKITAEMVAQAAGAGDELSREVIQEAMECLAIGIVNLITLFDPEAIILCGRVALAGEIVLAPIRAMVASRSINVYRQDIHIGLATYGPRATVMGALALILDEVLNLNLIVSSAGE